MKLAAVGDNCMDVYKSLGKASRKGAGDSFIAGFLKGVLDGISVKECMQLVQRMPV